MLSLVSYIQIDLPHFKLIKSKTDGERKFTNWFPPFCPNRDDERKLIYWFPSSRLNENFLFEVVKGNSIKGNIDKFIGVLNMHVGNEAISMMFVRLSYTSI